MRAQKTTYRYYYVLLYCLPILSLIIGAGIYILLRKQEFIFYNWIRFIGFEDYLISAKEISAPLNFKFPNWVVYSLPSCLWAFAYALLITLIWSNSKSIIKYLFLFSIPVLFIGWEVFQLYSLITGTFSIQDIILGAFGALTGFLIGFNSTKLYSHEKIR